MKTVFFDLDDTLYFRQDAFFSAVEKFFDITDLARKHQICASCSRRGDEVFSAAQRGEISVREMYAYRFTKGFADEGISITETQALDFQAVYQKELYSLRLSAPTVRLLDFAKDNFDSLGIITNGPSKHQRNKIKNLCLENWFSPDLIFVSGEYDFDKPDKRIFLRAQERVQKNADDLIFVGDSFCNDIIPASELGWHTVWLNRFDEPLRAPEYASLTTDGVTEILKRFLK